MNEAQDRAQRKALIDLDVQQFRARGDVFESIRKVYDALNALTDVMRTNPTVREIPYGSLRRHFDDLTSRMTAYSAADAAYKTTRDVIVELERLSLAGEIEAETERSVAVGIEIGPTPRPPSSPEATEEDPPRTTPYGRKSLRL